MSALEIKLQTLEHQMSRIERYLIVQNKELLTVEEAALFMGVSPDHIYRLTGGTSPVIGFSKPNAKMKYIEKNELLAYMRNNRVKGSMEINEEVKDYERKSKRA